MEFRFEQHGRVLGGGNRAYVTRLGVVLSRIAVPALPALKSLKGVGQHGFRPRAMTQTPVAEAIGGIHEPGELESAGRFMLQDFRTATLEHGPGQDIPITHSEPGDLEDTVEMQAGVLSVTGWVERVECSALCCELIWWERDAGSAKTPGLISYGRVEFPPYDITTESDSKPHARSKVFMENEFWMLWDTSIAADVLPLNSRPLQFALQPNVTEVESGDSGAK